MEKLRDRFARETDPAKLKEIAEAAQIRATEWTPYVHLGEWRLVSAARKNVSGFISAVLRYSGTSRRSEAGSLTNVVVRDAASPPMPPPPSVNAGAVEISGIALDCCLNPAGRAAHAIQAAAATGESSDTQLACRLRVLQADCKGEHKHASEKPFIGLGRVGAGPRPVVHDGGAGRRQMRTGGGREEISHARRQTVRIGQSPTTRPTPSSNLPRRSSTPGWTPTWRAPCSPASCPDRVQGRQMVGPAAGLIAGQTEVMWSNLFYTPPRAEQVDFVTIASTPPAASWEGQPKKVAAWTRPAACAPRRPRTVEETAFRDQSAPAVAAGKPAWRSSPTRRSPPACACWPTTGPT